MDRVGLLLPAFQAIYDRGLADPAFRKQFGLRDWEEHLLTIDPGFSCPSPTSRFDSFYVSDSELMFTEFNTRDPRRGRVFGRTAEIFYGLPVFQEFQRNTTCCRSREARHPSRLAGFLLLLARNRSTPPRIAILDWREVPTFSEFVLHLRLLQAMGVEARIIDPRELEYSGGRLTAGDYHITMIYKRVLISELIERCGLDNPVVRAVRDRAVCMANSFRCKILFKKASFAVVGDERNLGMFTSEQQKAIAEHIP